jgi:hypothetical protein
MTTRTDQVPEGALRALGVVDSITKPFSPEAILAVVSYCLDKHGTSKRQETTRVTALAAAQEVHEDQLTSPEQLPVSDEQTRLRADRALKDIAKLIADGLFARGISDADSVATGICADLRASLSSTKLQEALRQPQPSLTGDLAAVPLPEVLQLLKFQAQTGLLEISLEGAGRFEVAVKNGMIVSVRARDVRADLLLGHYFLGAGMLSRAQLDAILSKPSTTPIGHRLVEAGLVTTEQLRRCVGAQAQDLMTELLRARRGFFGLRRGEDLLPSIIIQPGFSVDMLLFEALRRIDEWGVIEKHVPSFTARFTLHSDDIADLAPDEIEVLSVFKEGKPLSVNEVIQISSLRAFDACKLLYRLTLLRRLRRVDDGAPPAEEGAAT